MQSSWMVGLFLLILQNRESQDDHPRQSRSLLKPVSGQTKPLDGVDDCLRGASLLLLMKKKRSTILEENNTSFLSIFVPLQISSLRYLWGM